MIINQSSTLRPLCIGSRYKTPVKVDFITHVEPRAVPLDPNPSMSRKPLKNKFKEEYTA